MDLSEKIICSQICPNNYVLEIKYHPQDEQFHYSINIKDFEETSTGLSQKEYSEIINIIYSNEWVQKLRDYIKGKNTILSAFGLSGMYIYKCIYEDWNLNDIHNYEMYYDTIVSVYNKTDIDIFSNDINDQMVAMIRIGAIPLVIATIVRGANDWSRGLIHACNKGNITLINLMIEKGANNFNEGLIAAEIGGYKEIILLMILKGSNIYFEQELNLIDIEYLIKSGIEQHMKYNKQILEIKKNLDLLYYHLDLSLPKVLSNIIKKY